MWSPIFERFGVDMVLTGHDHEYERSKRMLGNEVAPSGQGVPSWVVGTGGAALKAFAISQPAWTAFRSNSAHGFLDVVIDGGTLTARLVTTAGAVLDTYTVTKPVPEAPTVQITVDPAGGAAPHTAALRATTNLPDALVTWTFGDGATATSGAGAAVSHSWAAAGSYTVEALARGNDGRTATATTAVLRSEERRVGKE